MNQSRRDITIFALSIFAGLILWFFASPLTPVLIFYGNDSGQYIIIQNLHYRPVTDVTIEFDPNHKLTINSINYEKLSGELITNYTDHEQRIYHVSHMYPNDRLLFNVTTAEKNQHIEMIVRSNEGGGQPAPEYFGQLLIFSQFAFIVVVLVLAYQLFTAVIKFLKKDMAKQAGL